MTRKTGFLSLFLTFFLTGFSSLRIVLVRILPLWILPLRILPVRRNLLMRLVAINCLGLLAFLAGLLWLGQTRESLTQAYRQSLRVQAIIMAEAVGGLSPDSVQIQQMPDVGDNGDGGNVQTPYLNPLATSLLLRRLVADPNIAPSDVSANIRVRYYDGTGKLVVDTARLPGVVRIEKLESHVSKNFWERFSVKDDTLFFTDDMARNGAQLSEVTQALAGEIASLSRRTPENKDILTMAVPVRHYRAINGILLLTSPPGTIDTLVAQARNTTFKLFLGVLSITLVLTVLVARAITIPVKNLAGALQLYKQRAVLPALDAIPDYSARADEVADLSVALRELLEQLVSRLDAIERFAADVAHELKNPLASLQSALQTLELTHDDTDRQALIKILLDDMSRLNRLITDISAASRLDADLVRQDFAIIDFSALVSHLAPVLISADNQNIKLDMQIDEGLVIRGQENRLAQILCNLLDNALSFTPPDSVICVQLTARDMVACLVVKDEGRGVSADVTERIFERFYTDRADLSEDIHVVTTKKTSIHSGHSGLGLSIARDIARVHGGDIQAKADKGGCFILTLPLMETSEKPR